MVATVVSGSTFNNLPRRVIQTDSDYKVGSSPPDDVINVIAACTLTLPDSPVFGEVHLIVAAGGAISLKGGIFPIVGGDLTLDDGAKTVATFTVQKKWVCSTGNSKDNIALTQTAWFINAQTGKDNNSGATSNKPLKTWAELNRRWGKLNTIEPSSGETVQVKLQTDLPSTDPVNTYTFMKALVHVRGTMRILQNTATITTSVAQDFNSNQANQIRNSSVANNYWGGFIGKHVLLTTGASAGAKALILKDLNNKTARLGEWSMDDGSDVGTMPMPAPAPGDKYQIVDYSTVYMGNNMVGADPSFVNSLGIPAGMVFHDVRYPDRNDFASGDAEPTLMQSIGASDVVMAYQGCLIDCASANLSTSLGGGGVQMSGCGLRRHVRNFGGLFWGAGTASVPFADEGYPGTVISQTPGAAFTADRVICQGDISGTGATADMLLDGKFSFGALAFFDSIHGLVLSANMSVTSGDQSFGDYSATLWGSGNHRPMLFQPGAVWQIFSTNNAFKTPVITNTAGPQFWSTEGDNATTIVQSSSFNAATGAYTPEKNNTYALLTTPIPAGFLTQDFFNGPVEVKIGVMVKGAQHSSVQWQAEV
jgi:hypothetical protein